MMRYIKIRLLIFDLKKAEKILAEYSGGYSGEHFSAEDFRTDFVDRIEKFQKGDESVIDELWLWFAPTCQWDDFVGDVELGNRIFKRLNKLKK